MPHSDCVPPTHPRLTNMRAIISSPPTAIRPTAHPHVKASKTAYHGRPPSFWTCHLISVLPTFTEGRICCDVDIPLDVSFARCPLCLHASPGSSTFGFLPTFLSFSSVLRSSLLPLPCFPTAYSLNDYLLLLPRTLNVILPIVLAYAGNTNPCSSSALMYSFLVLGLPVRRSPCFIFVPRRSFPSHL